MLKHEIEVGKIYNAKISGKLTKVKIKDVRKVYKGISRSEYTHWTAVNLATKREVTIRSAAKLRSEVKPARCLTCSNCKAVLAAREAATANYRAAVDAGSHDALKLREEYRALAASLPCTEAQHGN